MRELSLEQKRELHPKKNVLNKIKNSTYFTEFEDDYLIWVDDKEVVIEAVRKFGAAFKYSIPELKNDKEILLEAVKQNGYCLEFVSEVFKNDIDIVLAAIKQNGLALRYAAEQFKGNEKMVRRAMKDNVLALEAASEDLQNNKQFLIYLRDRSGKQNVSCNKDSAWFIKKMEILESLEDDAWMRKNIPVAKKNITPRKF